MNNLSYTLLGLTLLVASSCSPSYKFINAEKLTFTGEEIKILAPDIEIQYLHPTQLGIKSTTNNQFMIAVKITNNRDTAVFLRQPQFLITSGQKELVMANPAVRLQSNKEDGASYLYYKLADFHITYLKLRIENEKDLPMLRSQPPQRESALADGAVNLIASRRNRKRYKQSYLSPIFAKPILPKQSVYGLIPVSGLSESFDLNFSYLSTVGDSK